MGVCGVWRIARGSQAVYVNGAFCQHSRLLIHQTLLSQKNTAMHLHKHSSTDTSLGSTQSTQMHYTKQGSRERLKPHVWEDGVCLYQTNTFDGAGWWGLLWPVWAPTGSTDDTDWVNVFLRVEQAGPHILFLHLLVSKWCLTALEYAWVEMNVCYLPMAKMWCK